MFNIQKNRKTIKPSFKITLNENETKTYYVRASSDITTLIVKLTLLNEKAFYQNEIFHQSILSLFFGAMLILAFYNIFIFFFTKDKSYFYYVLYILSITLHHTLYTGFCNLYFSQWFIIKSIEYATVIVAAPAFTLALFTKYFLQTNKLKKTNFILTIFLYLVPISLVFFALTDDYDRYRSMLTLVLMAYLIFVAVYSAIKHNRQAYFVLSGWFLIFVAILFMMLSSYGVFNIYSHFPYFIEVAILAEAVIFAIALADRINNLQKEKNEISEKLLEQKQNETIRLSKKVDEKTYDLKVALDEKGLLLKELNHRVKNNMQTIVSLIRLQSDEIEDKKLIDVLTTIQNRINAMGHLHELLYKEENINDVNAKEYFHLLIDEAKNSYDKEVNINFEVTTNLKVSQAIYCGLILNELISNSFKHAFKNNKGNINISLKEKNSFYILKVKDDGQGFDSSNPSSSLGLILVQTLSEEQLKGKLQITSKNGVEAIITWRKNE